MSEDVIRDPLLGKLARFQPSAAGIDRDGMLFAAGRASARARRWKLLTGLLAVSQAATVCAWFLVPRTAQPAQAVMPTVEFRSPDSEPSSVEPMSPASYGGLAHWCDRDDLPAAPPVEDPVSYGPTLTIGASQRTFNVD
jgi:hypothetical protein